MADSQIPVKSLFARNRAEELGHDVWQHFVVPPFFDRLDLQTARKPRVIIAGRGCGKTMLLRYLSHESTFSLKREFIPDSALEHIGLYWRADTQFTHAMVRRDLPDDIWQSAFNHLLALVIGLQLLESLGSIARSSCEVLEAGSLKALDFSRLQKAYDSDFPADYTGLIADLETRLWAFQNWVNDVRKVRVPQFLPGRHFVLALVKLVRQQIAALANAVFFVYLDEYENLLPYQMEIIHTSLKHSEAADGLIFNLAVKRNVIDLGQPGPESLANIHDWRYHDLEAYLLEGHYSLFAAEILFLNLSLSSESAVPIDVAQLRDPERLAARRSAEYASTVLGAIRRIFPSLSEDELAEQVFAERPLLNKLRSRIERALKRRRIGTISPERFLRPEQPKASIIVPALLHRGKLAPEGVLNELDSLEAGKDNRFFGKSDWVNNYFVGCLLQLYGPYSRSCPFYAGFDRFCDMSHGNLRHMLELCHQSVQQAGAEPVALSIAATPMHQADAAHLASALFLNEIRKFGPFGIQLHGFVLRLGSVFALAQDRPSQSAAEVTHFSVASGALMLSDADNRFLDEAVKWSVLFREKTTKRREMAEPQTEEYVLNPIYAPYFHISYRRRSKLALQAHDLIALIRGDYDAFRDLLHRYSKKWSVDLADRPTLFAHLDSEPS
jgi:hypothetical protein